MTPGTERSAVETSTKFQDMGALCESCAARSFRRSKLQWKDVSSLLSLRYPVRCLSCSKRQAVGLGVARRAVPSSVQQVKARHDGTPWSAPVTARVDLSAAAAPVRTVKAMPDLHGVKLDHVAYVPPGSGENLAS